MKKQIKIVVGDKEYPCLPSMGAMLRFRKETGKEINEIDPSSFTELCTYLWCCVCSASKREGVDFDMSLMDFADSVMPEDMTAWGKSIMSVEAVSEDSGEEKKSL